MTEKKYDFSYPVPLAGPSVEETCALLSTHGVALLPKWLDDYTIKKLRTEFDSILSSVKTGNKSSAVNPGRFKALKRRDIEHTYPVSYDIFSCQYFTDVSNEYIGQKFSLNDDIFVTDHSADEREILPLHYDRLWCLKFYIYLKDTQESDGAFTVLPGSHHRARKRRESLLCRGMPAVDLPNKLDFQDATNALPIEAPAGSLIIFNTDTLHKGGTVAPGGQRLVMRGHTHKSSPDKYAPEFISRQWIREHRLNPLTAALRAIDLLGRKTLPKNAPWSKF